MVRKDDNIVDFGQHRSVRSQALERLYRAHGAALRTFLLGRMGRSPDIEEIVQDVFVRLSRMEDLPNRVSGSWKRDRAYIFTIANNLLVDFYRKAAVRRDYQDTERELADELKCDASPEMLAQSHQMIRRVEKELSRLPIMWQKAFVLSRFEYMSHEDIADQLGLSLRSVERYIGKALLRLRKAAERAGGIEI